MLNKNLNGFEENKPLTKTQTAEFFNVSVNCINDWTNKGILTRYKVGQRAYYMLEELLEVLNNSKQSA